MSYSPEEIASELIRWLPRRQRGIRGWPANRGAGELFGRYLSERRPLQHSADVDAALQSFGRKATRLVDWFDQVLEPFEDGLVFTDGAPRIRIGHLAAWRRVTATLDPDALVALRLARLFPDGAAERVIDRLPQWGHYLSATDAGLDRILARGLADAHVHLEACDPAPSTWSRLMAGHLRPQTLTYYSHRSVEALSGDAAAKLVRFEEKRSIDVARAARARLSAATRTGTGDVGSLVPLEPLAALRRERTLLLQAWRDVVAGRDELLSDLDAYLCAKQSFLERHVQAYGAGLGLNRFREFLDRGEALDEARLKKRNRRVRTERISRLVALASEPRDLKKLELRIAPLPSVAEWTKLLGLWQARFAPTLSARGISCTFVVHFIRDRDPAPSHTVQMHFGRLRGRLDRQTAVLHLFRHKCPQLARLIRGIDVANLERGCPPELFAPYLALLRSDGRLAPRRFDQPGLYHWSRIARLGFARAPDRLSPLGLTYHAGEDFYHPVDGVRHIWSLNRHLLRSGDRIGHALALGWDIDVFHAQRRPGSVPCGLLLDDLVWMRSIAQQIGCWSGEPVSRIDTTVAELSETVYGRDVPAHVLERALGERYRYPGPPPGGAGTFVEELIGAETYDRNVARARDQGASERHLRALTSAPDLIRALQGHTLLELRRSGVTLEMNPSSNLATETVSTLSSHPYFRVGAALGGDGITSFNTDDPGVFGTRIDVEYALMFEAMLERGIDRSSARALVEEARLIGCEQVF